MLPSTVHTATIPTTTSSCNASLDSPYCYYPHNHIIMQCFPRQSILLLSPNHFIMQCFPRQSILLLSPNHFIMQCFPRQSILLLSPQPRHHAMLPSTVHTATIPTTTSSCNASLDSPYILLLSPQPHHHAMLPSIVYKQKIHVNNLKIQKYIGLEIRIFFSSIVFISFWEKYAKNLGSLLFTTLISPIYIAIDFAFAYIFL